MKNLSLLFFAAAVLGLSSCAKLESVLDKAESIPGKMDALNSNMERLEDKSTIDAMEKRLLDVTKYDTKLPVQFKVNEAAKVIGESFTAQQAVDWVDDKLSEVNGALVVDKFDDVNAPEVAQFENEKLGTVLMLTSVCGLLPQATVIEIVKMIQNDEDKLTTMLTMLSMRAYFLNNVLLKEKYASAKLKSVGAVEEAIKFNQRLEYVLRLPFASYIKSDITGFSSNDMNTELSYGLDMASAKANWKKISYGLEHFVKVNQFSVDADQLKRREERQNKALAEIKAGLASWNEKP